MTAWIQEWFGSEYYSMLYRHRDCNEAKLFLDNLISFLKLSRQSSVLDCGCGKGRHSIYLSEKGFDVTGVDISEKNIEEAKTSEKNNLTFYVHDIRNLLRINYYDMALSLFTSFGYFENDSENEKIIKSMSAAVKPKGWVVLDFMNAVKEMKELIPYEKFSIDKIGFEIRRKCNAGCIEKEVLISENGKDSFYTERVRIYTVSDFKSFFSKNKLEIVHLFGDYHLSLYDENTSDRLIFICRKIL